MYRKCQSMTDVNAIALAMIKLGYKGDFTLGRYPTALQHMIQHYKNHAFSIYTRLKKLDSQMANAIKVYFKAVTTCTIK